MGHCATVELPYKDIKWALCHTGVTLQRHTVGHCATLELPYKDTQWEVALNWSSPTRTQCGSVQEWSSLLELTYKDT